MKLSRGTLAGGLTALVATGAVMMAPLSATAEPSHLPSTLNLKATLVSTQSSFKTAGIATYRSSLASNVREFKVSLKGLPVRTSVAGSGGAGSDVADVRVVANGELLAMMRVNLNGTAWLDLSNAPVMRFGMMIKVTNSENQVLCAGTLRVSSNLRPVPHGATAHKPGATAHKPGTSTRRPGTSTRRPGTSTRRPGTTHRIPSPVVRKPGTTHRIPSPVVRKPGTTHRIPSPIVRKPGTTHRIPSPIVRKPGTTHRGPVRIVHFPITLPRLPITTL